jgi:hypothetical protein
MLGRVHSSSWSGDAESIGAKSIRKHPDARLGDMVPSAYLRVFQPLDAFDRDELVRWERYLVEHARLLGRPARYVDRARDGLGVIVAADGEHAEVRVVDGRTYLSPWRMRMRVLAAAVAFRETKPVELADRFLSKKDARRAARELNRLRRRDPNAVTFCHQSAWHVPIRWFVLFDDHERWFGEDEHGRHRLRYRTTARRALRRAGQAIPVLRRSDLGPISELLLDLHEWIGLFDPKSLVELDYATLCDFLTWDELDDDRSVREVGRALDALERHEFPRSADIYQGVLSHWAEIRGHELLN